jgi:predicted nucleic acid-binding protein
MAAARVVVDASVALKWVMDEPGSTEALALLEGQHVLNAPDFLLVEVANVLWVKLRRGLIERDAADLAFEAVSAVPVAYMPLDELILPARSLAQAMDLTVYDALYAAAAQRLSCPLFTADAALARAVDRLGLGGSSRLIGRR